MLSCRDVVARSSALLDGELPFRARLAVWLHLVACVHCRRFIRHMRVVMESLQLRLWRSTEPVSAEFVVRVVQALESAREPTPEPGGPSGG